MIVETGFGPQKVGGGKPFRAMKVDAFLKIMHERHEAKKRKAKG
jgi:hypothetical protein